MSEPLTRLGVGDSGDDVRRLHATLRLLGTAVPAAEAARGAFGEGTAAALRRWQESVHLEPSGSLDARTGDRADAALGDQPGRTVLGRVTAPGGGPVAGLVVRAYDANLAGDSAVEGTATTDADGRYELHYSVHDLGRPGKPAADLVVRAFAAGGDSPVAASPVVYGAGPVQLVPLTVATAEPRTEYDDVRGRVEPALQGTSLARVGTDREVAYLSGTSGVEPARVSRLARAAALAEAAQRIAGDDPVARVASTPAVFFALAGPDPAADLAALLDRPAAELAGRIAGAARDGLIPAPPDRATLIGAVLELQARQRLRPADGGRPATLGDLLRAIPADRRPDDRAALAIARLHAEEGGATDGFWRRLPGTAGLGDDQVREVRLVFAIGDVTRGDPGLVRALRDRTPDGHDGTLAHLAPLRPNQWLEIAASALPDGAPATAAGATLATATELARGVERQHPSATFKARLDAGLLRHAAFPAGRVAGFLGEHPGFHLVDTAVEPYLSGAGLAGDTQLRAGLLTAQRLLRAGANQVELAALVDAGLGDLAELASRDRADAVARLRDRLPEWRVSALHARAQVMVAGALALGTTMAPRLGAAAGTYVTSGPGPAGAANGYPSIAQLFGDGSACACGQCRSVLSPAAYLVDLIHTVERAGFGAGLKGRRPDLTEIELTCANTNTTLPYVDLVLEILESAAAFPSAPITLGPGEADRLLAGTAPASLLAELTQHGADLDEPVTVAVLDTVAPTTPPLRGFILRNGSRRLPAHLWRRFMVAVRSGGAATPQQLPVPEADIDATRQALAAGQVPPGLLALLAPEPEAPVAGVPAVTAVPRTDGAEQYEVSLVRSVVVELYGGGPVGAIRLLRADGTEIRAQQVQPGILVLITAGLLGAGQVFQYLANLLPPLSYTVTANAAAPAGALGSWTLTAPVGATVAYSPDQAMLLGLTYSSSDEESDGAFPEHRDPEAYRRLAGAVFPADLPFDLFREEVRACLAIAGTTRLDLLRALAPAGRYATVDDACETLGCAPATMDLVTAPAGTADQVARLWGLKVAGNGLTDPQDAAAPVPPDWIGALSRLSVLLDRARIEAPTLLAILGTRYLAEAAPGARLDPEYECKASRVTVTGLGQESLDRLQRFLRLRRITGWPVRDTDLVLRALARPGTAPLAGDAAAKALGHVHELAARTKAPVRVIAAWLGALETSPYTDHERDGSPALPSLYEEVYLDPKLRGLGGADFALDPARAELAYLTAQGVPDPAHETLTDRLAYLSAALRLPPVELAELIGSGPLAVVPDALSLDNLGALYRQASLARALGIGPRPSRVLQRLTGITPLPGAPPAVDLAGRRILEFVDALDAVRASGLPIDELSWCLVGTGPDDATLAARRLDQLRWLADLQAGLREVQPAGGDVAEPALRALLGAAGWPAGLIERVIHGEGNWLGLAARPPLEATVTAAAPPAVAGAGPFTVTAAGGGRYVVGLAGIPAAAQFDALAQLPGLAAPAAALRTRWDALRDGIRPLTRWLQSVAPPRLTRPLRFDVPAPRDGQAPRPVPAEGLGPAVRATGAGRVEIDGFLTASDARRLRSWVVGATNETEVRDAIDPLVGVPAALGLAQAPLSYDPVLRELVLLGYPAAADVAALTAIVDSPGYSAAVQALVAASDAYTEPRASRRLLDADAVQRLFIERAAPQQRYAAVQDALVVPLRRQRAVRMLSVRTGVDERLLDALDGAAEAAAPPVDIVGALASDELLGVAIRDVRAEDALSGPLLALDPIDRAGLLVRRLGMLPAEAGWLSGTDGFQGLDLLGLATTGPASQFAEWRAAATLFALRELIPGGGATLERVRTAASAEDGVAVLANAFDVPADDLAALLATGGAVTGADRLRDPAVLRRIADAALILRRLRAPGPAIALLCAPGLDQPAAAAARGLVPGRAATAVAAEAAARLRERQRAALVAYLVHRDGVRDAAELHARYLLDVEMGPRLRTSRIKQAISSTQLYIQRLLLNLEGGPAGALAALARQAAWVTGGQAWEANRRVFLYPENWLEPSLRDDKSHLFGKLEGELLQGDLTTERAISLVADYLAGLEDLGRLTIRAMYRQATSGTAALIHVVGRSSDHPLRFFYRQWTVADASRYWTPWEPVESVTNTEHVVCFVRAGRPHIAWLQVGRSVDQQGATADSAYWDVELLWCFRTDDGWSAPRKWRERMHHPVLVNKNEQVSFALRVQDHGGVPQLRVYGAQEPGVTAHAVDPIPVGTQMSFSTVTPGTTFTTHRIEVQVVGELQTQTGPGYFAMDEARVEIWGSWKIDYEAAGYTYGMRSPEWPLLNAPMVLLVQNGTASVTLRIPQTIQKIVEASAEVSIRITVAGVPDSYGPIRLNPLQNNTLRLGKRYPIAGNDPRFDPNRRIRMMHLASFEWANSLGLRGGPPGDGMELPVDLDNTTHESSGFREGPTATTAITWGAWELTRETSLLGFFAVGSAASGQPQLGPPFYVEEADAAVLLLQRPDGFWTLLPASEYLAGDALAAITAGGETLDLGPQDTVSHVQAMLGQIAPGGSVSTALADGDAQFAPSNPASTYDWELYLHIPFLVATTFAAQQRYAEALRWLRLVFDPAAAGPTPSHAWRFRPFREESAPAIDDLLTEYAKGTLDTARADTLRAQIDFWREHPFRPHGIARMRTRAFQWMVLFKAVEIYLAWGDLLFRRDTLESMNEATQLYLLAAQLLGPRPPVMPEQPPPIDPLTYAALADRWDDFSDAWVSLADTPLVKAWLEFLRWLEEHGVVSPGGSDLAETIQKLRSTGSLAFCIPPNDRIETLRSTVEDRLTKIRASQNIDGIARQPALYEPAIDPALFVRAVAAGLDVDAVVNEAAAPAPRRRFVVALQRAAEFTAEVRALGAQLLSALEQRDGEELARLRAADEVALLDLMAATRQRELDEAAAVLDATRQTRQTALTRYRHYQRLLGREQFTQPAEHEMLATEPPRLLLAGSAANLDPQLRGYGLSLEEADQLDWMALGNTLTLIGGGFQVASGIAHMVPNFSTMWLNETVTFGGTNVGSGLGAVGQFFSLLASNAGFQANRGSVVGGHQRRYDDWIFQSNLAAREIEQIDKQILAAEIRVDLARRAVAAHTLQVESSRRTEQFLAGKFTNQQLYQWMCERLGQAHSAAFQLAYEMTKVAERALARELGGAAPGIVRPAAWENSRRGLLAAEQLALDLKRLEAAYHNGDERELEITKHLPLSELNPLELLRLRQTGTCTFDVPESAYDIDFPGHYFRRIKSVSVTVPCVVGPYRSVAGTLTLLGSRTRVGAGARPYAEGTDDPRFLVESGPVQSIATSTAQSDPGLFELNFRDELYLPFERCGAISRWRFELPRDFRAFDYQTISDLILHVRYTARDGGESLGTAATEALRSLLGSAALTGGLVRTISLRRQVPSVWHRLTTSPGTPQEIGIDRSEFPFALRAADLRVWKVACFVQARSGPAALTVEAPQPDAAGVAVLTPLALDADPETDIDGLTRYDATVATPIPVTVTGPGTRWRVTLAEGTDYGDVVIALWCYAA
ncbi:neuraminidase-like domain-containing protein [Dactylosporangium sp. CA-092794]|uniref:Tc toxin subunit A-related protein n=1 Tax=Dactylosporangium sp. CA-092794 TaxID=3239929 RepID=UPI003D8A5C95